MKKLILLCAILAFASCKNETKKEESAQGAEKMQEVVAVHDEMMPKMTTIGKLSGELKERLDAEVMKDSAKIEAMDDLKEAHNAMMDWMRNFGNDFTFEEINKSKSLSEEKMETLDEYEVSVQKMKEKMNTAIENARQVLADAVATDPSI